MFKKLVRGSFFITLMMVISITLSGCSFNIGDIANGLFNTLGTITGGVGKIVKTGLEVGKQVFDTVKPAVTKVAQTVGDVFGKGDKFAEVVGKGMDIVDKGFDIGMKVNDTVIDLGEKIKNLGQDSAGNEVDGEVETKQTVANPMEDENTVISPNPNSNTNRTNTNTNRTTTTTTNTNNNRTTANTTNTNNNKTTTNTNTTTNNGNNLIAINTNGGNTNNTTVNNNNVDDELLTKEEREQISTSIKDGVDEVTNGINSMIELFNSDTVKAVKGDSKELLKELKDCKNELKKIAKNPTSDESKARFNSIKERLQKLQGEANDLTSQGKNVKNTIEKAVSTVEDSIDTIAKIFSKW